MKNAITAPASAIQRGPDGIVHLRSGRAATPSQMRPVQSGFDPGQHRGDRVGMQAGDRVVTDGQEKLQAGMRVAAASSSPTEAARQRHDRIADMSISRPFILRPIATSLLMVGLLLVGIVAYRQLPDLGFAAGGLSDHPGGDVLSRAPAPTLRPRRLPLRWSGSSASCPA